MIVQDQTASEESWTLFTGTKPDDMNLPTYEARNTAVLDSGCTSTVSGANWMSCYFDTLPPEQAKQVKRLPDTKRFKFGGGETKTSLQCVEIPCILAGQEIKLIWKMIKLRYLEKPRFHFIRALLYLHNLGNFGGIRWMLLPQLENLSIKEKTLYALISAQTICSSNKAKTESIIGWCWILGWRLSTNPGCDLWKMQHLQTVFTHSSTTCCISSTCYTF